MSHVGLFRVVALKEMGLGPIWRLREPTDAAAEAESDAVRDAGDGPSQTRQRHIAALDPHDLADDIAQCTACQRADTPSRVTSRGAIAARCIVVTDELGAGQVAEEHLLMGDAARLMSSILRSLRFDASMVQVIPLVKCASAKALPTADEALKCRPYLTRQLELSEADLIIALGQRSADAICEELGMPRAALGSQTRFTLSTRDIRLFVIAHPREAIGDWRLKKQIWQTLGVLHAV